jgi:putative ABC transport system ATP-binding protein
MSEQPIIFVENLSKIYKSGDRDLTVLHEINFSVDRGTSMSIIGPSGSGKTTLLGLCAGLDRASTGSIRLNNIQLDELDEDDRARLRNQYVGFVFQNFQLIPTLSAVENVMVPSELRGETGVLDRAADLLSRVGLENRLNHYPIQLSGGEQQRVAIARAFINKPIILFVDEPTGNLDTETSEMVEHLLFQLNEEAGTTLVLVTHDMDLAQKTHRILRLKGGKIIEDVLNHNV